MPGETDRRRIRKYARHAKMYAMNKEFHQSVWNEELEQDWLRILALAVREDLGSAGDCTTEALVPEQAQGRAAVVVRQAGVLAGEAAIAATLASFSASSRQASCLRRSGLKWSSQAHDGQALAPRQSIGILEGPARAMLAVERPLLNMLGRLSGIASLTRRYVDAVSGTRAGIYDTRKTTPGWRSLEKYAVRCGGGRNHRAGLFEAVLIKDNHLALGAELRPQGAGGYGPAEAVLKARQFLWRAMGRRGPADDRGNRGRYAGAARRGVGGRARPGPVGQHESCHAPRGRGPSRCPRCRRLSLRHPAASTWARCAGWRKRESKGSAWGR